ncbi:MAG TPA: MCE family protein [Acidimicrobiales bacterium]|nr:MCE family protein [Acidimicrobiales bacterium]
MSRAILGRIAALLVVTVVGLYYILFDAIGLKITNQPFTIHAVLPAAGGIYSDASVTYRGVEVGKVTAVHLYPGRVVVDMAIRNGEKIPQNVDANVKELTAAAEQYMDLVPAPGPSLTADTTTSDGPYLTRGYTIPQDRTSIPVSIGTLLATVNSLVSSLNPSDLNTLSHALAQGLQGAGDDLRSIIVDGSTLLEALQSATPGTISLIDDGNTVLNTFNQTAGDFADFSHNLNLLSAQVAQSNTDLIKLLQNGAAVSNTANQQLQQYAQPTIGLLADLGDLSNLSFQREPAFRALFQVLPLFATDIASTSTNGQIRFELTFNYNHTVCPYTSTMAEPNSLVAVADLTLNCGVQAPDLLQRGADKAPAPQG